MKMILELWQMSVGAWSVVRYRYGPLALAGQLVFDVVDSEARSRSAQAVLGLGELVAENLVIRLVLADGVYDNLLLVVGDLVDDEIDLAVASAELLECEVALILDLDS
jgi:hypothetical protein